MLLLLAASLAAAWTPYRTQASHCPLRWYGPGVGAAAQHAALAVEVQVDDTGLPGIAAATLRDQLGLSLQAWNAVRCPEGATETALPVQLSLGPLQTPTAIGAACAATDSSGGCTSRASNGNFVRVIDNAADWPYGSSVFALTVLTYNTCTGQVIDGDILLDGASHAFCAGGCDAASQDLRNTLTHEVGHLLGMDHSDQPLATMYFSAPAGEVAKASLHSDDLQGVCAMYASGCGPQHSCQAPAAAAGSDDGGCGASPRGQLGASAALALGAWMIAALLRRRRAVKMESRH